MVFGPTAPIVFCLLFWVGGLGALLALVAFANLVQASPRPFSKGRSFPVVVGLGFAWGVGVLLALLWNLGIVSNGFMEGTPLYGIVATALGLSVGIRWARNRDSL